MYIFKKYFFSIIIAIGIFYLSTASPSALPEMPKITGFDKFIHVLLYAILAFALSLEATRKNKFGYCALAILFPILYGGLIEILQHYVYASRVGDWYDFWANTIGVLIGYLIAQQLLKYRENKK